MEDKLNDILKRVEVLENQVNAFESLEKSSGEFTNTFAELITRLQAIEAKVFDRRKYGIDDKDHPINVIEPASSWMPYTAIKIPELDSNMVKVRDYNRQASIFVSTENAESAMQEIGDAMTAFKDSLQVHEDDAINKFEADLIKRFPWKPGMKYMAVDSPYFNAAHSDVWQFDENPMQLDGFYHSIHGMQFLGNIVLPENISYKDCLFTRKDQSDEQQH